MRKLDAVGRRAVGVVLLLAGLVALPSAPALADGGSTEGQAQATQDSSGVVQDVLDWLLDLVTGEAAEGEEQGNSESDGQGGFDPDG